MTASIRLALVPAAALAVAAIFAVASPLRAAEQTRVWPLPALTEAATWRADATATRPRAFFARDDALFVRVDCAGKKISDLRLVEPVAMPPDATGFTFRCGNNGTPSGLRIKAIVRDATGGEFFFYTSSWFSFGKGVFFPEHIQRRGNEDRFVTPGMQRLEAEPSDNATVEGPAPRVEPRRPYSLAGIRFVGEHQGGNESFTEFFFRDFAFTRLQPQSSSLYYQFRDQECFGELDPLPFVTPAHLGKWYGRRFDICWDVRAAYDSSPFLADGRTFRFDPESWRVKSDRTPYQLQQAHRIEFPIREKGTYWVRVRLRWSMDGRDAIPREIIAHEYRLDVLRGESGKTRRPVSSQARITNCFVRVAPERESLTYGADETFHVTVQFRNPGAKVRDVAGRVVVRAGAAGEQVKTEDVRLSWDDDGFSNASVDLTDLPAGAYEVHAVLLSGARAFDETRRLVGRREAPVVEGRVRIPASVASARDLLRRPRSMFHLSPILPDGIAQTSKKAWDEHYRPFLDRAGAMSRDIELPISWKTTEPLPGVFDWRFVDRFVAYAQAKGLTVLLWPSYRDLPEWMPGLYEQNVDGQVFGSRQPYLFHGGRPNYVHAAAIRDRLFSFVRNVVLRYRGHPSITGYYYLYEHPGDAPYAGWYEGYAEESVQAFRRHCQKRWRSVRVVNRRWGTRLSSWREVVPPPRDARPQYWLDWLRFKTDSIEGLLKGLVEVTREVDPRRLIAVYADGLTDFGWFRDRGCLSANGGSHDVMGLQEYAAYSLSGLPQRTEDHSPGNWSAYFPTQLDASVFAMLAAGGVSAHAKAFTFTKNRFTDAGNPDVSLGRYERFMPIWREMRDTKTAAPIRAFMLKDLASYLVDAKTTYTGWWGDPWGTIAMAQAQVPCASGYIELWEKGKLLVIGSSLGKYELLEESLIDRIERYVENGGSLLMSASAGRRCIDDPDAADWVLLRRFGFDPPAGEPVNGRRGIATPMKGEMFPATAEPFTLRETWDVRPQAGTRTAARFDDDTQRAAVSWKTFGEGRVAILWAQTMVPPLFSGANADYAFLGDVASWAGIQPLAAVTDNRFWTNLLESRDGRTYYGLVHVGWWQNTPSTPVAGSVRWLALDEGTYTVTELISGKALGDFSAEQLKTGGLDLRLAPRAVAIFRMARQR